MAEPNGTQNPVLLHIGPHKTGTTAIQGALAAGRARLREHGVIYPGHHAHEMAPAMAAALEKVAPGVDLVTARRHWDDLIAEIHRPDVGRGILSSEFYSETPHERIPELIERIGPDVHVVVTVRPLVRLLASQWQQYMQNQMEWDYEGWLEAILDTPEPGPVTPSFWTRHRHDRVVERWLDAVGPGRLTVVVVDESDHEFLLRAFEELLSVPEGTLQPAPTRANRSLSWDEVELIRRFNREYRADGLGAADYTRLVRFGAVRAVQQSPVTGSKILTPDWAIDRISELGAQMAARIEAMDVPVIGSLDRLGDRSVANDPGVNDPVEGVDLTLAAAFAAGLVTHLGRIKADPSAARDPGPLEQLVTTRHRAARAASTERRATVLRAKVEELEARIDVEQATRPPSRRAVLGEITRRIGNRRRPPDRR